MNDNNEIIQQNNNEEKLKNISTPKLSIKRESLINHKGKELKKRKKASSLQNIFNDNHKINININQNINISRNINQENNEIDNNNDEEAEGDFDAKSKIKMKSCIMGFEYSPKKSERIKSKIQLNSRQKPSRESITNINNMSKSREIENSFKMDKLLARQTRTTKDTKKPEEFLEFYINDNLKNAIYKFKDNTITTTKYNIFTFLPKGLLYQFSRLSNVYFLFTAIIQSIPLISPLTSLTAIIPLIFVLGVSMIRELIEDLRRNNYDNLNNEEEVIVFRNNKFVKSFSKTLRQGEIILVYENNNIPADIILIDTGFGEGTCYVETSSLDGEKTLKLKVANKYTQGFISNGICANKGIEKYIMPKKYFFSGIIKINAPNANLNYINGTFHPLFIKRGVMIEQDIILTTNEFLLKGSVLKNTNWIIGIVVYTGMNNKIILNSKKPRLKMSKIEKQLNFYLLFVFGFLILCCTECSLYHHFHYINNKKFYDNFILISNDSNTESFIIFFTYFLLLNTFIPISLIVSVEIIKIIQGIFMEWDILLYSKWKHCFCSPKSVSIIEELGNVNFIFSDKTGTLTKNQLQFKYCIIDTKYYEIMKIGGVRNSTKNFGIRKSRRRQNSMNTYEIINHQYDYDRKKLSFLSENNKIMINKETNNNASNENYIILNNNKQSKTKGITSTKIDQDLSSKDIIKPKSSNKILYDKSIYSNHQSNNKKSKISVNANNNSISGVSHSINSINNNMTMTILSNTSNNKMDDNLLKDNNYTILESKNEENDQSDIIRIGEGYFANSENNPFLKIFSYKNINKSNSFNYIHEFWIALALTNECMVKYEKDDVKYMGSSPDDLELVRAASQQGYKLIETNLDTKTLTIGDKNFTFEILKVLGFSSERRRMSIIVKDKNGIKLYIKGADCEIIKRLSKRSLKSENYEIISNGLKNFSQKGLRTLMVAFRKINEKDYTSWINKLHEDELNIENKQKMIDRLYDIIENNLTLIGGTVVEDKLQENVPETIKELRAAGIKLWVLTGDKLDTAKNIGYSCNLLSSEQKLFTLKVMQNDEILVKEDPFKEMNNFFIEFQEYINELVKKYNLESKYLNNNCNYNFNGTNSFAKNNNIEIVNASNLSENVSEKSNYSSFINFEIFKCLSEKNILEPYSIIIEAPILYGLFKDDEMTKNFFQIAYHSNTVICCRVSPSQKSQVIQQMKNFNPKAITLAIGDGGNDVSMIMEANIGIGIYGEEGLSAAQASDFAIGEFQLLKRLLFFHGRTNLYRISKMILYFFYKNFIFTMAQFYYSFLCLSSGQTIVDDWYITCYNLIFTALPLCVRAITDSDINLNNKKFAKKNMALLYKENRDNHKSFTFFRLLSNLLEGIIISFIISISTKASDILNHGYNCSLWYISLKSYICILIVVSMNILINSHFISYLLPLSIGITTVLLFIIFLLMNHYGFIFNFNSKATIGPSLSSINIYLSISLISFFNFIIDYSKKLTRLYFNNSLSSKLILDKSTKRRKKSYLYSISYNKVNIKKPTRNKVIESNINENEKSNNFLISKSSNNKLNLINPKINKGISKKKYLNLNYVPKISKFHENTAAYRNDFFSLNILKNLKNNKNIVSSNIFINNYDEDKKNENN